MRPVTALRSPAGPLAGPLQRSARSDRLGRSRRPLPGALTSPATTASPRERKTRMVTRTRKEDPVDPVQRVETLSSRLGGKDDSYLKWEDMLPRLRQNQIQTVSPAQASSLIEEGEALLIDVREEAQFDEDMLQLHPTGSVNIPLYVPSEGDSTYDNLRRMAYRMLPALGGTDPTELNSDFVELVMQLSEEEQLPVMLMCERGGNFSTFPMPGGVESRSLVAVYCLLEAGFHPEKILHVQGGFQQWEKLGFDCEYFEYEE